MKASLTAWLFAALVAGPLAAAEFDASQLPPTPTRQVSFEKDIYPILLKHCFKCHLGSDAESGIRLDTRRAFLGEGDVDSVVELGRSADSRLIQLVSGKLEDERMPPEGELLSAEEVSLLRGWVDQNLPWDEKLLPPPEAAQSHWAFQPIVRPPVPSVKDSAWVRTPVDAFVAADHQQRGLKPLPQAAKRTLIRRLSLDLLGLPPTQQQIQEFLNDNSPQAYERLVDRLLASPHYGERWGRHWLDVARWAETEGYESNHPRNYAWRYRDWVVNAFNADMPYDMFLRLQIAGDEVEPYRDSNLVATGFLAAARLSSNEEDKALQRNDVLVDIVNATGNAVLGLAFGCAQCHSHKWDPITQRDYYALQGFFVRGQPNNLVLQDEKLWAQYEVAKPAEYDPAVKLRQALLHNGRERLEQQAFAKLSPEMQEAVRTPDGERTPAMQELARQADLKFQFTPNQIQRAIEGDDKKLFDALTKKIAALKKQMPDKPQTWGFYAPDGPNQVEVLPSIGFYPLPYQPDELRKARPYLLKRGDVHNRGNEVAVRWPAVFGPVPEASKEKIQRHPRSALADWLADRNNPLVARVWANRVWHFHFGRGIVATPGDFGLKGEPPSHPKLLDWLAAELMENGWSTKHLHRQIVLSSTYRQASGHDESNARLDPENLRYWRWEPRRLEAEAIRDSILAATGELNRDVGGPAVKPEEEGKNLRRSLYLYQKRDDFPAMQKLFDAPTANESCSQRYVSTVALQPLYLLNNEFVLRRAEKFAARVRATAGYDQNAQIQTAFEIALGRWPDDDDMAAARAFFAAGITTEQETGQPLPLVHFCQALLNLNEIVYID